jgi:kynurenine formamidase
VTTGSDDSFLPFVTDPELQEYVRRYLTENKAWGRWGADDQRGAANLITDEKRLRDLRSVRSGRTVSLSRDMIPPREDWVGHLHNEVYKSPQLGDAVMRTAEDRMEIRHHGLGITHLDALCHVWLSGLGMWNGRDACDELPSTGATWGDVAQWRDGLCGRAVLLDVPGHRGVDQVQLGQPVTADELRRIEVEQGSELRPGDLLMVYSGREHFEADPSRQYQFGPDGRPGLSPTCIEYIHERDVSVLLWDMLESEVLSVHGVLWAFGVGIVDNCDFSRLVAEMRKSGSYDCYLTIAPLVIPGATGCAVNPIALI